MTKWHASAPYLREDMACESDQVELSPARAEQLQEMVSRVFGGPDEDPDHAFARHDLDLIVESTDALGFK